MLFYISENRRASGRSSSCPTQPEGGSRSQHHGQRHSQIPRHYISHYVGPRGEVQLNSSFQSIELSLKHTANMIKALILS